MAEYKKQKESFDSIFDMDLYNSSIKRGDRRFTHGAFKGAMMISLYRDEPRFHLPFQILTVLMDIDSLVTKWRCKSMMYSCIYRLRLNYFLSCLSSCSTAVRTTLVHANVSVFDLLQIIT